MQQPIFGTVFSIEEFSTFDGPGIRTTVFLKGCPLRCIWCHNPEGQRHDPELLRSPNGCLACGACLKKGAEQTGSPCLVADSVAVCPRNLIRLCGTDYTPQDLLTVLDKNIRLLNQSGGGVTFSGGEPLAQPHFLQGCLQLLRGKTNRALQTCGYAKPSVFSSILAECDYVLYDLKLIDETRHAAYTGVSNRTILQNYRTLAASGIPFCTRIPLIPTVNDTAENITATAELMRQNNVRDVEILPYNRMAGGKYALLGRNYEPNFDGSLTPNPHTEIFKRYGIEVTIL